MPGISNLIILFWFSWHSHGCIETFTDLYYDLHDLKKLGVKIIKVRVKFTVKITNGGTYRARPPWTHTTDTIGGVVYPVPKKGAFPDIKRM